MNVRIISGNIISPLGYSVEENFRAVRSGISELSTYHNLWELPFPFVASIVDNEKLETEFNNHAKHSLLPDYQLTKFEKMALLSAIKAVENSNIDAKSHKTLFILSSTKGNVNLLNNNNVNRDRLTLGSSANIISNYFQNPNTPLVISNACISGLCAQIEAWRCISSGHYDTCVVVGSEELSPFIVAGFNCLKALSDEPCKPFSANRKGLNLGEAAATMIISAENAANSQNWKISCGAVRNDANHISGPSRTAEGSFNALKYVLEHTDVSAEKLACINTHGTATLYNDEMEAIAIARANLNSIPVNALKGFYGHTLGAAGILETLLTMHSLDNNLLLPTKNFDTLGVSEKINICSELTPTDKRSFIKLLSGFGGCNAAASYTK